MWAASYDAQILVRTLQSARSWPGASAPSLCLCRRALIVYRAGATRWNGPEGVFNGSLGRAIQNGLQRNWAYETTIVYTPTDGLHIYAIPREPSRTVRSAISPSFFRTPR